MPKRRPTLKIGDVCKLSKRGKVYRGNSIYVNATMVVSAVSGTGADKLDTIRCVVSIKSGMFKKPFKHRFKRYELWFTGYNNSDKCKTSTKPKESVGAIKNNDGRSTCYICGRPTKTIQGAVSFYNCCSNSSCKWFNN